MPNNFEKVEILSEDDAHKKAALELGFDESVTQEEIDKTYDWYEGLSDEERQHIDDSGKTIAQTLKERTSQTKTVESEKPQQEFPVMIHRWFPDGDGWAYNPSVSKDFVELVSHISKAAPWNIDNGKGKFKIPNDKGWIIYTIRPDSTSKDPKAINRGPTYLTATIFSGNEPFGEELEKIYEQLENLPEVESRGQNVGLVIKKIDEQVRNNKPVPGEITEDAVVNTEEASANAADSLPVVNIPGSQEYNQNSPPIDFEDELELVVRTPTPQPSRLLIDSRINERETIREKVIQDFHSKIGRLSDSEFEDLLIKRSEGLHMLEEMPNIEFDLIELDIPTKLNLEHITNLVEKISEICKELTAGDGSSWPLVLKQIRFSDFELIIQNAEIDLAYTYNKYKESLPAAIDIKLYKALIENRELFLEVLKRKKLQARLRYLAQIKMPQDEFLQAQRQEVQWFKTQLDATKPKPKQVPHISQEEDKKDIFNEEIFAEKVANLGKKELEKDILDYILPDEEIENDEPDFQVSADLWEKVVEGYELLREVKRSIKEENPALKKDLIERVKGYLKEVHFEKWQELPPAQESDVISKVSVRKDMIEGGLKTNIYLAEFVWRNRLRRSIKKKKNTK